ncbi:MAG: hypothetical protein ACR2RE_28180 [Geminicoccaceae bacterium]
MTIGKAVNALGIMAYAQEHGEFGADEVTKAMNGGVRKYEQALQALVHSGFLYGKRGPRGGYEITDMGKIVDAWTVLSAIGVGNHEWMLRMLRAYSPKISPKKAYAMATNNE